MAEKYFVVLFDVELKVLGRFEDENNCRAEIELAEAFASFQVLTVGRVWSTKMLIEALAEVLFGLFIVRGEFLEKRNHFSKVVQGAVKILSLQLYRNHNRTLIISVSQP